MGEHNILLVDDEPSVLSSLKRALRGEDYNVLTAGSGQEALEILAHTPVKLVISDLSMPEMNGLELLRKVKERHPEVARLVLTGHGDTTSAIKAINEGEVYRFFTKPWDNDELRICIRQTLNHFGLLRQAKQMIKQIKGQADLLQGLERDYPGITQGASQEVFQVPEEDFSLSVEDYLKEQFPTEGEKV